MYVHANGCLEKKKEKEILRMLIAAAATNGGQGVFSLSQNLSAYSACGVSVGVSAAATGLLVVRAEGGG